ncbi:Fanconi anemia group J protein-like [Frieseomelitta varia]|uniref:Fanconi anemia group J protein-like n=1 Tax=Frieseomelitta varia TaxID=561572 RepID=UPI001CB6A84A|nr:Fanconi anemia group J protein-like [Frieseomelitta varia]
MSVGRFIHEDSSLDDEPTTSGENNGEDSNKKCVDDDHTSHNDDNSENIFDEKKLKKLKVSKIYYGTRTHKQIEQVVRELRKTSYRHKKMAILSSREQTCIQQSTKNKTELCNELLDPIKHKGCPFYNESNKKKISTFQAVENRGLSSIWDIEDLVTIGKNEESCPYFAARSLASQADIIFCPYNYIIDPDIRESMQLDLKDQVIILDEAHNIEDICREVASVSFREDHLQVVLKECESLGKARVSDVNPGAYHVLSMFVSRVLQLLGSVDLNKSNYNNEIRSSPYWTGHELTVLFDIYYISKPLCISFIQACYTAIADMNKAKEQSKMSHKFTKPVISPATKSVLDHLMFAVRMIFTNHAYDYTACVTEAIVNDLKTPTGRLFNRVSNDWFPAKHRKQHARTLKLMCMNPGVIFTPLAQNARSIILASGTLSPTATFESELGTSFPHVLKTSHVIPKEQVYATCIPHGPQVVPLRGTFSSVNSWSFQDEVGRVMLDICESMPHGILCFFSSYNVMHKHIERWKTTFTLSKISNVKHVFIEPRNGGDLAGIMFEYRQVIEQTSAKQVKNVTGALLLAVFRGKVAEGIDFKDDEARCVVTVGIPYPVRNDPMVDMKMAYNDKKVKNGLLRGSDWYSTQAFRALNQALGRCLRHIHDWGALLLIDERFLQDENKENLPKWVKTMWVNPEKYTLKKDLQHFVARQKMRDAKQSEISN